MFVTSDGHAIVRLKRAIANERCSATQIRALVAELPGPVGLEDALAILLALLDREPDSFSRMAARYPAGAWDVFNEAVFRPEAGARSSETELSGMAS